MLDLQSLDKYDSQKMYKVYDQWPAIAKKAFNTDFESVSLQRPEHIIFSGMGGSGAISDIISAILSKTNTHVTITKGYHIPKTIDKNTLVVATSVSGNTDEVMNNLSLANAVSYNMIAFASGGKVEKFCKEKNIQFRKIEMVHSPRASFTSFLYSILSVLGSILPIEKNDILESIATLEKTKEKISSANLTETNPSLSLANWINGIPAIYYPAGLQAAAIRFKNSLQENAKLHAMTEDVIEACHNGIVPWEKPSNVQPIFLEGTEDHPKTQERWRILREYFEQKNVDYKEMISVEGGILSKLINLIYILDYATIYKAVLNKTDPSPIVAIDFIKSKIQK